MSDFLKQVNLLYVEDSRSIREILSRRLERKVNTLYVAVDGEDGLNQYSEHKPDIVLTDITMPKMNGLEMSKKIKEQNPDAIIIALSAHNDSSFLLEAIEYGISGYLLKPIDKEKLHYQLESYAKIVCLNKVNKKQQEQIIEQKTILQSIMNAESNIVFVTDFNHISFANSAFLNFFNVKDIEEFKTNVKYIEDIFIQHENYLYPSLVGGCDKGSDATCFGKLFFDKLNEMDETKRVVLILDKTFEPKSFYINISIIDEDKHIYLITLTDITKMTIEKVKTEHKAYFDGLTQIYNRNKFEEFFKQEIARVKRYKHPLSIAILDIDHFKKFNDTYGHLIGDEVLIQIANTVNEKVRNTDMFARWGGEEFVILFVETKLKDAIKTSELLRHCVQKTEHKTAGKVTVSFGVTQFKDDDTMESLFKRCDEALYLAKENGRNRVEFKE